MIRNKLNNISPKKLGYIPALDGLRAIAVFLVMLLHAHFQLGRNGSLGVDIFFALSGFLITTLLLEEHTSNGRISLKGFYIRRTFRLFPALYFMLLIVWLYAIFFALKSFKPIILDEIFASSIYMHNISYVWGCKSIILGHTWSLGVEEQFYFIWPLVLIIALRFFSVNKLLFMLLFFIPFIWVIKVLNFVPILHGLIHESLFIGCLFALLRWTGKVSGLPNPIVILSFLLLLIVGILPLSFYQTLFHNNLRSIAGLVTMFVILGLVENPNSILNRLLSARIFVYLGKISYALYLWHLPVFRWFSWHSTLPPAIAFISKFAITFVLAIVSLELIEKRSVRIGRILSNKFVSKPTNDSAG